MATGKRTRAALTGYAAAAAAGHWAIIRARWEPSGGSLSLRARAHCAFSVLAGPWASEPGFKLMLPAGRGGPVPGRVMARVRGERPLSRGF